MSSTRPHAALAAALVTLAACADNEPLGPGTRQPASSPAASAAALSAGGFLAPIPVNIPSLYGGYAIANDVNDRGTVVGESDQRAFVWTATGGTRELPGLVPNGTASATAINADGWVAGTARAADGWAHAVKWSPAGVVTDLGTVPDGVDSRATGINRAGQVVGTAYRAGKDVGFLHDGATMTALLAPGQDNCEGRAINDQGVVALACASHFGGAASFRYAAGAYEVLEALAAGERTDVRGINGNATFVGSSYGSVRRR
jgi:probable HAF family extracellular repeat protein